MQLDNIINYFRDCYQEDNRTSVITNIFSKEVEYLTIIEKEDELVTKKLPYYPVSDEIAENINDVLSLHEKEKELVYFSFLLTGSDTILGKKRR
ncbi:MAG: hypothetical protein MI922_01585, partial [Bacteroidales bacterium]|nr:hypothetical protein [Bacteroidales bacterium]